MVNRRQKIQYIKPGHKYLPDYWYSLVTMVAMVVLALIILSIILASALLILLDK